MTADRSGSDLSSGDPGPVDPEAAHVARTLQEGLAPTTTPQIAGFGLHTRYQTGGLGDVGGDWYDIVSVQEGMALIIGDVAGHGITAAVTMAKLRHAALAYLFENPSPASVLTRLGRLAQWALPGEVATMLIAWVAPGAGQVLLASAGHLPPLLLEAGRAEFLSLPRGPALGLSAGEYEETGHPFPPGAALLLYTDGLVERRGESIDAGLDRLVRTALEVTEDPAICDRIVAALPDRPSDDDLALVMARRLQEA